MNFFRTALMFYMPLIFNVYNILIEIVVGMVLYCLEKKNFMVTL